MYVFVLCRYVCKYVRGSGKDLEKDGDDVMMTLYPLCLFWFDGKLSALVVI